MIFRFLIPLLVTIPLYPLSPETPKQPSTQLLTLLCVQKFPLPIYAKIFAYKTLLECKDQSNYENRPHIHEAIGLCKKLTQQNSELVPLIESMEKWPEEKKQEVTEIQAALNEERLKFYKTKLLNNHTQIVASNYTEEDSINDFFRFDLHEVNTNLLQKAVERLSLKLIRTCLKWGANANQGDPVPLTVALKTSFWIRYQRDSQDIIVQIINILSPQTNWNLVDKSTLNQAFSPNQTLSKEIRLTLLQQIPDDILRELYEGKEYRSLRYLEREFKGDQRFIPVLDALLARKKLMYPGAFDAKKSRNYAIKRQAVVNKKSLS